jgi:hypothetical protein
MARPKGFTTTNKNEKRVPKVSGWCFCNRHWLPDVHPLRNNEQELVDVLERAQNMAALAQVAKKSTPLFGKATRLVNLNPISTFHQEVEHLADSLE